MLEIMFILSVAIILIMGLMYLIINFIELRSLLKKPYKTALGEVISREYHHSRYSTSVSYTIKFYDINDNEIVKTTNNYLMGEENPEVFREHEKVKIIYFDNCNDIFFSRADLQNQIKSALYNILALIIISLIFIFVFVVSL